MESKLELSQDYEIRKNMMAHSRPWNALHFDAPSMSWTLPCEGAGNGKYFREEMHTRAWKITLDRCQSYGWVRWPSCIWSLGEGGSSKPPTPRISESLVFSTCPANTPFPVNYNYRRRLNVLRPEPTINFPNVGEGCARNSGKWGVFSIPFWSRELRFPLISLFSNNRVCVGFGKTGAWLFFECSWCLSLLMANNSTKLVSRLCLKYVDIGIRRLFFLETEFSSFEFWRLIDENWTYVERARRTWWRFVHTTE